VKKYREKQIVALIKLADNNKKNAQIASRTVRDHFEDVYYPEEIEVYVETADEETSVELRSLVDKNMDEFIFDADLTEKVETAIRETEE
jgi:hypothetical protein